MELAPEFQRPYPQRARLLRTTIHNGSKISTPLWYLDEASNAGDAGAKEKVE